MRMRRRDFIALLGGAAAWPLAARAQQPKRVGVLMAGDASGPINQSNLASIIQGLRKLGWTDDQNLQIEVRWSAADPKFMEAYATDLVGLFKPDVLLSDIGLPLESGYDLIQKIRSLPSESSRIPAVALTAFANEKDRQRALDSGFQIHLAKPVEPRVLIQAIDELVHRKERRF